MKVLVTGAAGLIGSNIVKILETKGIEVVALDNFYSANYRNIVDCKAELICADIIDEEIYKNLPKVDAVIHEAAITDTTLQDDTKMITVNFNGFKNIVNYCIKNKLKLVYASSAATYGDGNVPMKEDQTPKPLNTYAYSKYLCDCYMKKVIKFKTTPLIVGLRYFNVYGPGEYHKKSAASMTYQLYLQMKKGLNPKVFKYGEQKRDFIYVKDVARMSIEALDLPKSTIINIGTGIGRSFNDIITSLNKALNKNLKPNYFDNPYGGLYQDETRADVGLLNKFKMAAKFSLEEGIADYVKNYLEKK